MILYSKDNVVSAVTAMKKSGRFAHGFLLTGERGVGKKLTADYIARTLLCDNCIDGVPCGNCRHCRRISENMHPDVIRPERSGIKQIYTRDTIRAVCADAIIAPNDCDAKVYIFEDCENIEETTQNLMLKLIEEPPDTVYFIFTAADKSFFLPTILSRVITFGIAEPTEEECRAVLRDMGEYGEEDISAAIEAYHGNIGRCMEFLAGGDAAEEARLCRGIIDGMISGSEYAINKAVFAVGEKRDRIKAVLTLTDKVIRDVCIIRLEGAENARLIGCCREGAFRLAETLSFRRAQAIHENLCRTIGYCNSNVNAPVAAAALSGALSG
ncbi:MAG: ATP-binding protein [Oscillospiraceae bacterium]